MTKGTDSHAEESWKENSGSNGSAEVVHQETRRTKRSKAIGICKRFWWAFLLVLAIGVVAVTVPLVLVGLPRIVQGKMDAASVTMEGLTITRPTPDTVYVEMNSTIRSGGGISAVIDPFNASLYLEDKAGHVPFAFLQMPQTSADKLVLVNISQPLHIWNPEAYADFNTWFLLNESFRVTLDGNTDVHVKGLKKTRVNFHKTVTIQGLNAFKGLNVTEFSITVTADENGDNFHGRATIPNPSVLTVEIGNATFNNLLEKTKIGELFIDNLTIFPGLNDVAIRANISQVPVVTAVTGPNYCSGMLPFELIGESVIYNGEHLPYYEAGFKQNLQEVPLNISAALSKTLNAAVHCTPK